MKPRRPSVLWRRRCGFGLIALALLASLLVLAPSLLRLQWMARLALRELSLGISILALIGLALAGRPAGRVAWLAALLAVGVGVWPFASQAQALGSAISLRAYLLWDLPQPEIEVTRDLVLDPGQPELTADLWQARGPGPHPLVVAVHGGGWRGGDKGGPEQVHRRLAQAGYSVLDVRYRLAPEFPFPQAIRDVKCLLGRARARAAQLDIDPQRVALVGRSAGGQIVLVAAYSAADSRIAPGCAVEDAPVQGVVSVYGPTDLVWGFDNPMVPDVVAGNESLQLYLSGTPARVPDTYRLGSPLSWADHRLPPTLLIHGAGDQIVALEHARRLSAGLRERGQAVSLVPVPWGEHGFDFRPGGLGEQIARHAMLKFLAAALAKPR